MFKFYVLCFIFLVPVCVLLDAAEPAPKNNEGIVGSTRPETPGEVNLFCYFKGNGDGLHLAYSADCIHWTALRNDELFLTPQIGSKLMRDPCIVKGKDGLFHLVWTTGWNNDGFGYADSSDLITWSAQRYIKVNPNASDNTWAPDVVYDEATSLYFIIWATRRNDRQKQFYVTTPDFKTFSEPALYYDPGFSVIDMTVKKFKDTYYCVFKDERDGYKYLMMTTATSITGPFTAPVGPIAPAPSEGPAVIQAESKWFLYWDIYGRGRYGAKTTTDFKDWTDISSQINLPPGIRHGTIFRVEKQVLDKLLAK